MRTQDVPPSMVWGLDALKEQPGENNACLEPGRQ